MHKICKSFDFPSFDNFFNLITEFHKIANYFYWESINKTFKKHQNHQLLIQLNQENILNNLKTHQIQPLKFLNPENHQKNCQDINKHDKVHFHRKEQQVNCILDLQSSTTKEGPLKGLICFQKNQYHK